jgi:hypothetical protein
MHEDMARLLKLITEDLKKTGLRRPWKAYAMALYGDEARAEYVRARYGRHVRSHLPVAYQQLDARQSKIPLVAEGANLSDTAKPIPKLADFIQHAIAGVDLHEATTGLRQRIEVFIKTTRPIAIANMADFHIGSVGCDHERWAEDYDYLCATDGLYAVFNGDLTENCVGFPDPRGMVTQVLTPEEQDELDEINNLLDKIEASIYADVFEMLDAACATIVEARGA